MVKVRAEPARTNFKGDIRVTILQAIVMGLIQGLGEFLPISSTAHLILVPWFFGWDESVFKSLAFDVALHMGTLVAVLIFFWRDWVRLIAAAWVALLKGKATVESRLFWCLVVAVIPGGIFGILLESKAENALRSPLLIAFMLIIMGLVLYWVDIQGSKRLKLEKVTLGASLLIGFSQALAIIPGVSRSGVTMTAGLATGFTREAAARFSFLLSAPIILGAGLVEVPHLLKVPGAISPNFWISVVVSLLAGMASIGFLLRYLQKKSFAPFVWYRLLLGVLVIVVFLVRR
jgi:undecaprenyl-diphosphatase